MKKISIAGALPRQFEAAFSYLAPRLRFENAEKGFPVRICHTGRGLSVRKERGGAVLCWEKRVQLYRAFSILCEHWEEDEFFVQETPCFETLGIMLDVSRNGVLKPQALKGIFEKMALMGIDLAMMYTEDTYEIPEQPYFGWMRGRYSIEELRELDDYADCLGIELCPCIQTLGHLNRALHWPSLAHLRDNEEVILADEEQTYVFLEQAIRAAVKPYRSKRIHIGMDEAHGIGLGAHLARFGYEDPHAIIRRHLNRVCKITDKLGLDVMMWSDMYFRPDSPTNGYYDSGEPSEKSIAAVNPNVTLVYWDYYHEKKEEYDEMLRKHRLLGAPAAFAGGIWVWAGPAPDYEKTIASVIPGLESARDANVPLVLATAWGDNGAEANFQTALLGMQLFAEFDYTGCYEESALERRFAVCTGGNARVFARLSAFNTVPGMRHGAMRPVNAAKFMLYQDPLVQLFEADTQGCEMAKHYAGLEAEYAHHAQSGGEYALLFRFYGQLAGVLKHKCAWHEKIGTAVRTESKEQARALCEELRQAGALAEQLRKTWRSVWNSTNKPFGFEVIDGRMGALCARCETACARVQEWLDGGQAPAELLEQPLVYTKQENGTLFGSYAVGEIVSACKID